MANTTFKDRSLQALAILGLIAILLIGAWGIIQIAFALPEFISNTKAPSITKTTGEKLNISLPSTATSGKPLTVAWQHTGGSANYSYAVVYSCADGLTMKAPVPTGAAQAVPCNTPFNFTNASANLTVTPTLAGTKQVQTTITVLSNNLATGAVTAGASSTVTILPAASAAPTTATKPSTSYSSGTGSTYVASGHRSNLYGLPDLSVQILPATSPVNGRYSVQFVISNVGTNVVHSGWTFSASLPLSPAYTYQSPAQQALYPGDKIVYTLGFDTTSNQGCANYAYPYTGAYNTPCAYPSYGSSNTFSVTADPQGLLSETSRGNNTAAIALPMY